MSRLFCAPLLLAYLLLASLPVWSQEPDDWIEEIRVDPELGSDWVRPQSAGSDIPYLGPEPATVLRSQARSFDPDSKQDALRRIDALFRAGELNPDDPRAVAILSFLALEMSEFEVRRAGRVMNDYPLVRAEAVRILGAMGGVQAGATVTRVLEVEADPYVLAEAIRAVGNGATSAGAVLLERLTFLVTRMNAQGTPDNALAYAVVEAVASIHERSGRIDDPELFRALITIAQGRYSLNVRRRALAVVEILRKQDLSGEAAP